MRCHKILYSLVTNVLLYGLTFTYFMSTNNFQEMFRERVLFSSKIILTHSYDIKPYWGVRAYGIFIPCLRCNLIFSGPHER